MIHAPEELAALLSGGPLHGATVHTLWPPQSTAHALAIDLNGHADREQAWLLLRSLLDETGRYPLLTQKDHAELALLEVPDPPDDGGGGWVEGVVAEATKLDPTGYLSCGGHPSASSPKRATDLIDQALDENGEGAFAQLMIERFGQAPPVEQIRALKAAQVLCTNADFERWLLDWEVGLCGRAACDPEELGYLDGHEFQHGDAATIVLLPTRLHWQAFLYMGWYGMNDAPAQAAALRSWGELHGAELAAAYGTTLHLRVARPPAGLDEAFMLALAHYHFAPDTFILPQVSLRKHAKALQESDRWFFHARP